MILREAGEISKSRRQAGHSNAKTTISCDRRSDDTGIGRDPMGNDPADTEEAIEVEAFRWCRRSELLKGAISATVAGALVIRSRQWCRADGRCPTVWPWSGL